MEQKVGGYTEYRKVTDEDLKVFHEVKFPEGVGYTPKEVATQVVNGINYQFKCIKKVVAPGAKEEDVIILIHKPNQGEAKLMEIIPAN
ncbi:MAG: hypothetical protein LBV72_11705 [Tannerella sp.]|jgi:hypothetical protein|nr:hypothetical protein [Tannerella sp.]